MSDGCYYGASLVGISRIFSPQTEAQNLQKTEVHSRFCSSQVWWCFIKYRSKENDIDDILGYASNCPNGERTVGSVLPYRCNYLLFGPWSLPIADSINRTRTFYDLWLRVKFKNTTVVMLNSLHFMENARRSTNFLI